MSETRRKLPSELRKEQDDRDADLGAALRAALQAIDPEDDLVIYREGGRWESAVAVLDRNAFYISDATHTFDADLRALLRSSPPEGTDRMSESDVRAFLGDDHEGSTARTESLSGRY